MNSDSVLLDKLLKLFIGHSSHIIDIYLKITNSMSAGQLKGSTISMV